MAEASRRVDVTRVRNGTRERDVDRAATEEPLEIRLHGRPFAVIMRTPGADRELAAGFLLAERVLKSADDLGVIEYCTERRETSDGVAHAGNVVNVTLATASAEMVEHVLADRRHVVTNSSCGLCGRRTIESLRSEAPPIGPGFVVAASVLRGMPDRLRQAQAVFACTGGIHAAGLFTGDGQLDAMAEDVGRHNAVDKVIGRMLMREALPLGGRLLLVSGRTSFEIVQKAFLAGIPVVASVSAPSTLAIELAEDTGVTLAGFVRGDTFNIYTHSCRIE